jgi:hypothetical protein
MHSGKAIRTAASTRWNSSLCHQIFNKSPQIRDHRLESTIFNFHNIGIKKLYLIKLDAGSYSKCGMELVG